MVVLGLHLNLFNKFRESEDLFRSCMKSRMNNLNSSSIFFGQILPIQMLNWELAQIILETHNNQAILSNLDLIEFMISSKRTIWVWLLEHMNVSWMDFNDLQVAHW